MSDPLKDAGTLTRCATDGNPYAIGVLTRRGFRIRCVRFGKLHASYERRDGEQIRAVMLLVTDKPVRPVSTRDAAAHRSDL